jgi:hypothetical protein
MSALFPNQQTLASVFEMALACQPDMAWITRQNRNPDRANLSGNTGLAASGSPAATYWTPPVRRAKLAKNITSENYI